MGVRHPHLCCAEARCKCNQLGLVKPSGELRFFALHLRQALCPFVDLGAALLGDQIAGRAHLAPFAQVRRIDPVSPQDLANLTLRAGIGFTQDRQFLRRREGAALGAPSLP